MTGYIHSIQSLGTVDGPGVRTVVFTQGCPLRCVYCHNPDTWEKGKGETVTADTLCEKILRFYPYIKNGGVTFSGGEPCLQADFLYEVALKLKEKNLHIALDTSGVIYNKNVERLLEVTDLVLLDIKMTSEEEYRKHIGMDMGAVISFLRKLEEMKKEVWIRHVVVPGINDNEESILRLKELLSPFSCITKTELLPFRTLCLEKYENMGIDFPLKDTPQMKKEKLEQFAILLQ